jgi:hypothetical protein
MPKSRLALSTSVVDGIIYVFGGADGTAYLRMVEAYDPPMTSIEAFFWGALKGMFR